jgi:hypothetical protein
MSTSEHPDSLVVERLGGPSEVGRLCRIRPQAVSQWKRRGIPDARRDFLALLRPDAFVLQPPPERAPAANEPTPAAA